MTDRLHPNELSAPPPALADAEAQEVLRGWIVDRALHVTLQRGFDDPAFWGIMLVDLARHASRAYEQDGVTSEAEALNRICQVWTAELGSPTDLGTTAPLS